jgi:hypothetical protein
MINILFYFWTAVTEPLTGTWKVTGEVAGHSVSPVCKLVQTGTTLSGECTSHEMPAKVAGEVNQSQVIWRYSVAYEGQIYTLTYSGQLQSPGQIEGSIDVPQAGTSGTFRATKD